MCASAINGQMAEPNETKFGTGPPNLPRTNIGVALKKMLGSPARISFCHEKGSSKDASRQNKLKVEERTQIPFH